jgi:CRISPR/Cas system-associated protein Cas10 (large subunit of type III CRISPR-Cas system)
LTLSAGVAFTPPGIPVRHAASRAERLLRQAKKGTKDQCAALDGVWKWDEIANICGQGRRLARHVEADAAPRTLLHRFYRILSQDDILTPARWSYHMARHFRAHRARTSEEMDFQQWCETVDRIWDQPTLTRAARSLEMARAALLYSLTATRSRRES